MQASVERLQALRTVALQYRNCSLISSGEWQEAFTLVQELSDHLQTIRHASTPEQHTGQVDHLTQRPALRPSDDAAQRLSTEIDVQARDSDESDNFVPTAADPAFPTFAGDMNVAPVQEQSSDLSTPHQQAEPTLTLEEHLEHASECVAAETLSSSIDGTAAGHNNGREPNTEIAVQMSASQWSQADGDVQISQTAATATPIAAAVAAPAPLCPKQSNEACAAHHQVADEPAQRLFEAVSQDVAANTQGLEGSLFAECTSHADSTDLSSRQNELCSLFGRLEMAFDRVAECVRGDDEERSGLVWKPQLSHLVSCVDSTRSTWLLQMADLISAVSSLQSFAFLIGSTDAMRSMELLADDLWLAYDKTLANLLNNTIKEREQLLNLAPQQPIQELNVFPAFRHAIATALQVQRVEVQQLHQHVHQALACAETRVLLQQLFELKEQHKQQLMTQEVTAVIKLEQQAVHLRLNLFTHEGLFSSQDWCKSMISAEQRLARALSACVVEWRQALEG